MDHGLQTSAQTVSVVIPCHNAEQWLGEAILSVLNQTHVQCEIIVVDDASTDRSVEVAESFGEDVRLIRGEWRNGNSARNEGLKVATGSWIQFLDADDKLRPDKISEQLTASQSCDDAIYSPLIVREERPDGTVHENVSTPTGNDLNEQWLRWELCQTGAALWRTESLRGIGGWKEGLPCCQDNEVTLRALMNGLQFRFSASPGAIYRIWSEATVCRKDPRRVIHQKTALIDEFLLWLGQRGQMTDLYREVAGQACFEMARTIAKYDLSEAKGYFHSRRRKGLITVSGPAAPKSYRVIQSLAGFSNAERVAAWIR